MQIKPKIEWEALVFWSGLVCVLNIPQEEKDSEDEDEGEGKEESKSDTPASNPSCTQRCEDTSFSHPFIYKCPLMFFIEVCVCVCLHEVCKLFASLSFSSEQKSVGKIIKFGTNIDLSDPKR